jgi:hypothetical protein
MNTNGFNDNKIARGLYNNSSITVPGTNNNAINVRDPERNSLDKIYLPVRTEDFTTNISSVCACELNSTQTSTVYRCEIIIKFKHFLNNVFKK